jgi:hypothetical protein
LIRETARPPIIVVSLNLYFIKSIQNRGPCRRTGTASEFRKPSFRQRPASYESIFIPPNLFHASAMPIVPAG